MDYLMSYKVFEEDQKDTDLSDELKTLGKDIENHEDELRDVVIDIAKNDPEIQQKFKDIKKNKSEETKSEETNEGLTLGLALSSPVIIEYTGKLLGFLGKKLGKDDQNKLAKVGGAIEKFGHGLHHWLLKKLQKGLRPLTFWMSPKKQEMVANVVFMTVLAVKVSFGSFDPSDFATAGDLAEGALNGIKSTEISSFIGKNAKGLLSFVKAI